MLEWLKTPTGAYNFHLIVTMIAWMLTGVGLIASFHLNKVRTVKAIRERDAVEQQLRELQTATTPKPLRDRVRIFLDSLDNKIMSAIRGGQRQFTMTLTFAQAATLQTLAGEDTTGDYIAIVPSTDMIMNAPGAAGKFTFRVGDATN